MSNPHCVLQADAARLPLRDRSVHCAVTSPPYFNQRVYGDSDLELGNEALDDYVARLVAMMAEVGRVLRDDGLLWVNIGDKSAGSGGPGGDWYAEDGVKKTMIKYRPAETGLARMQWCGVPWRFALRMQACGWLLRCAVTWDKGRVRRGDTHEPHVRRPGIQTEDIFLFAKTQTHVWYPGRLDEPGDVWRFSPKTGRRKHDAPFPDELPRRCILPSTREGDVVLDPFGGSHTTADVARGLGRVGVSCDLYARLGA